MSGLSEALDLVPPSVEYVALLVWQITAEVDPWVYYRPPRTKLIQLFGEQLHGEQGASRGK